MPSRLHSLVGWSARVFGDDLSARVFEPLVADWHRDREAASTTWQRLGRDLAGTTALAMTFAQVAVRLSLPWDLPTRDLQSIGLTLVVHAAIGLALGLAPFMLAPLSGPLRDVFLVWMVPAMMAVSLTVALLPTAAVIYLRSRDRWAPRAPWLVATVTIATMAGLVVLVGWVSPASKQEFRVRSLVITLTRAAGTEPDGGVRLRRDMEQRARLLPRGVNELTLPELVASSAPERMYPEVTAAARRREAGFRLSLVIAWPATFAFFGWRLARSRQSLGALTLSGWWALAVVTALVGTFGGFESGPRALASLAATVAIWLLAAAALRSQTTRGTSRSVT